MKLDLFFLVDKIKKRWGLCASSFSFVFLSCISYFLFIAPVEYRSSAVLMVTQEQRGGNQANQLSNLVGLGGLSSLIGSQNVDANYAIELIQSKNFLKRLIQKDESLIPKIYASSKFDKANQMIIYKDNLYNNDQNKWVRKVKSPYQSKPNFVEIHSNYLEVVNIFNNRETGFLYLSTQHVSPIFSFEFLEMIVKEINLYAKEKDLIEIEKSLNFLYEQYQIYTESSVRASINNLIESNLEKQMYANTKEEYLLTIIDAPYLPLEDNALSKILVLVLSLLLSTISTVIFLFLMLYREGTIK
tara:strand:+ start:2468 stop:3370 length:903 start_codon:yes stop_codon:yes gene_type:complete